MQNFEGILGYPEIDSSQFEDDILTPSKNLEQQNRSKATKMKMPAESFIDLLKAYGDANLPSMIYHEGQDFSDWQQRFQEKIEKLRGALPKRTTPKVETIDTVVVENHMRHLLRIQVSEISTLIAYLLIPLDPASTGNRPGLIVSHGHAKYGIDSVCGVRGMEEDNNNRRAYALEAVRDGYVVLAPAWWGWVGRDGHLDHVGNRDRCNVIQMVASMYGINILDLHIQDGQAAIDVLASRPEVDDDRIGCIGNSYGGRTAMWLAVFDQRIKACVPAGCMNTFRERSLKLSSCGIQYLPGLLQYGDVPEVFSLIAPRPMQLQAGRHDPLITPVDRDAMLKIVQCAYRLLDVESNLDYVLHADGHLLLWEKAASFLKMHL